jgi:hypothetical protein
MNPSPVLITSAVVIGTWSRMQARHGTRVILKQDDAGMKLVGGFLDVLGVLDKKDFLESYSTTIDHAIYVPFQIGDPAHDLLAQLALCAHEHQHVIQVEREGWTKFAGLYLFDQGARGGWEAEGYRCNMELSFWATGMVPEWAPQHYAERLGKAYACNAETVKVVATALELVRENILEEGIVNQGSREVIDFAEKLAA